MNARLLLASSGDPIYSSLGPSSYFPPANALSPAPTRISLNPTMSRATVLSAGTLSPQSEHTTDPMPTFGTAGTWESLETYSSVPIIAVATSEVAFFSVDVHSATDPSPAFSQ